MRRALIALAVLTAACGKNPGPDDPTAYTAPDGSFSARLPAGWKVDEAPGETRKAAFYGPPNGAKPFSQLMGVYFHAAPDPGPAARAYLASAQDGTAPVSDVKVGDATGLEATVSRSYSDAHLGPRRVVTRTLVVAASGGFFSLEHTWPADEDPAPAFGKLAATFHPATARKSP